MYYGAILERGTEHVESAQLFIVIVCVFARCGYGLGLARKFMGATGVVAVEAAGALPFRPERRRLLARTSQAVPDSRGRDLPQ
ncbi:hypothetical protein SBA7_970008 [Candidatus Sulfotelmatobacter sp. SbA7]|nr:hypothetical protein SBA7_970008 [Candidatus Sulfotelmatobacter sp. SbA7]